MSKEKKYKVTGISHYTKNIMKLASKNEDFKLSKKDMIEEGLEGSRVYEYDFYGIKARLEPEPDNQYDPNAVKVLIDDLHVGYIKSGSCTHILNIMSQNRIEKIDFEIGGGKYKFLGYDEYEDKYFMEKEEIPFYIHLNITEI